MKKLIALLAAEALAITGCTTIPKENFEYQKKVFSQLGIPIEFADYKKNLIKKQPADAGGRLIGILDYDTNSDGKKDVREVYDLMDNPEIPFSYMFDLDGNNLFTLNEILMDDFEDGLNGNERWSIAGVAKVEGI
jgi:hypothetical protein